MSLQTPFPIQIYKTFADDETPLIKGKETDVLIFTFLLYVYFYKVRNFASLPKFGLGFHSQGDLIVYDPVHFGTNPNGSVPKLVVQTLFDSRQKGQRNHAVTSRGKTRVALLD